MDDINISGSISPVPVLVFPYDGDTVLTDVFIDWLATPGQDTYHFMVDTTPLFNSPLLIEGYNPVVYTVSDSPDTRYFLSGLQYHFTYYWRVRSIKGGIPSAWSQTWHFIVDTTVKLDVPPMENQITQSFKVTWRGDALEIMWYGDESLPASLMLYEPAGKCIYSQHNIAFIPYLPYLVKNLKENSMLFLLIIPEDRFRYSSFVKKILLR